MKTTSNRPFVQRKLVADQGDKTFLRITRTKIMADDHNDDMDIKQVVFSRHRHTRTQAKHEKNSLGPQQDPGNDDRGHILVRLRNSPTAAKAHVELQSSRRPSLGVISMKPPTFPKLVKTQADHKEIIPAATKKIKASAKSLNSSAVTQKTCNRIHCGGSKQSVALDLMEDSTPNFNVDSGIFFPCDHSIVVNNDTKVLPPRSREQKENRPAVPGTIAVGPTAPDPMEDEQQEEKNGNSECDQIDDGFYAISPNKERFFSSVVSVVDNNQSDRITAQDNNVSDKTDLPVFVERKIEGSHLPREVLPTSVMEVDFIGVDSSENRTISNNTPMVASQVALHERDPEAPMTKRLPNSPIMKEATNAKLVTSNESIEKLSKSHKFILCGCFVILVLGVAISAGVFVVHSKLNDK